MRQTATGDGKSEAFGSEITNVKAGLSGAAAAPDAGASAKSGAPSAAAGGVKRVSGSLLRLWKIFIVIMTDVIDSSTAWLDWAQYGREQAYDGGDLRRPFRWHHCHSQTCGDVVMTLSSRYWERGGVVFGARLPSPGPLQSTVVVPPLFLRRLC